MDWLDIVIITLIGTFKEVLTQQQQQMDFYVPGQQQYNSEKSQNYNFTNLQPYVQTVGNPALQQYSNPVPTQQDYQKALNQNMQSQEYYNLPPVNTNIRQDGSQPCTCGVFLSGQFIPNSNSQPVGNPALTHEHEDVYSCNASGTKTCTNKCLDIFIKHLSSSPTIICGTIDRDCHKERAYLWIKNCKNSWVNTNMSPGREFCCKNGLPYKCPIIS